MMTMNINKECERDDLFRDPKVDVGAFCFDEAVANVFPDMIARSVPGYQSILSMIPYFSEQFVRDGTRVYDLGCSLGACSLATLKGLQSTDVEIIAVDNSKPMITRLVERLDTLIASWPAAACIRPWHSDVVSVPLGNASLVILNFTLQFIPCVMRDRIIRSIYNALLPGGALILSEKLEFTDPKVDQAMIQLHHAFKRDNGYTELEISRKRDSLENVLIRESQASHVERMKRTGFERADVWFQCLNFASFIAVKT